MAKKRRNNHYAKTSQSVAAALPPIPGAMQSYPQTLHRTRVVPIAEPKRFSWRKLFKRIFLTIFLVALLTAGWLGWKFYDDAVKATGDKNPLHLFGILHPAPLKGEDQGRVNILVAGDSSDDPGHQGADLTDSIMVLSIDTRDNTAFMLSIPRDTLVDIPGVGHEKINAANEQTNFQEAGFPNGGMGELEFVVEQDTGIPIDYYALVNYTAFKDAVNAVDGIDVNIQSSDSRGLYDPSIDYATGGPLVDLPNGIQHLDGEQALDLARARGDSYGSYGYQRSDYEREQNQRLMVLALKSKALSAGVLSNPIKISQLADSFGNNVQTDLPISGLYRLYQLSKNLNNSNIQSLGLDKLNGKTTLTDYVTDDGEDALIPTAGIDDFSQIQADIQQLLTVSPSQ